MTLIKVNLLHNIYVSFANGFLKETLLIPTFQLPIDLLAICTISYNLSREHQCYHLGLNSNHLVLVKPVSFVS